MSFCLFVLHGVEQADKVIRNSKLLCQLWASFIPETSYDGFADMIQDVEHNDELLESQVR